ncbi:MAG: DNA mismatch repair endonuclease MutL [Candidatus Latescibacterota bacterium]|nr:MAG: DNA mismatch repair endonuclease MutL [Candidatus Latescibacterota bacterium]
MSSIHVLDPHTVNKIAAGEVVERPASIVKELLDNALDARATRITIDLESGGRSLVRVSDDGIGMSAEDLELAVQRHATSKLTHIEDLLRIGTLGFRGEALAAIAAVSRLTLTSRPPESDVAQRLEMVDGQPRPLRPVAAPVGTSVAAAEIFYNVPARREFLRSASVERRAVLDLVSTYALVHPQLRLLLRDDGRDLLDLRPAATLRERAAAILGRPMESNLVEVHAERDAVRVEGLASRPPYGHRNRSQQYVFVNGRPVRDRTVSFAITHAYRHTMQGERFPVVVLFLSLPSERVDVNVHPTKKEVRFRDERLLHGVVVGALSAAVGPPEEEDVSSLPRQERAVSMFKPWREEPGSPHADGLQLAETLFGSSAGGGEGEGSDWTRSAPLQGESSGMEEAPEAAGAATTGIEPGAASVLEAASRRDDLTGDEALYWQLHNAYILIQIKNGLVLVDQHAAHERVLYDKAVDALEGRRPSLQRLLFPIPLELSVRQYAAYEESRDMLEKLGFQVRPFGGRSVLVEEIPAEISRWEEGSVLLAMLDDLAENRETKRLPLRDKVLATYACRAAIMQGKRLSVAEMRALMDQLFATTRPYTCPHGRPSLLRIGLDDLDRRFGR